jgi:hypothetical protein
MAEIDQDAGMAAALAGVRELNEAVAHRSKLSAGEPPFPINDEQLTWIRNQIALATADGIEEGAKRVATRYGTYGAVVVGASVVAAVAAVGILIAILVKE